MCSMHNQEFTHKKGWRFIFGLPFMLAFLAAATLAIMLLWNALLPSIFDLKAIGYWQALGLLVLARILFGSFGRGPRTYFSRRRQWELWKKWHEEHPDFSPHDHPHGGDEKRED